MYHVGEGVSKEQFYFLHVGILINRQVHVGGRGEGRLVPTEIVMDLRVRNGEDASFQALQDFQKTP